MKRKSDPTEIALKMLKQFDETYDELYEAGESEFADMNILVADTVLTLFAKAHKPLYIKLLDTRGDIFSSDREVSAIAGVIVKNIEEIRGY